MNQMIFIKDGTCADSDSISKKLAAAWSGGIVRQGLQFAGLAFVMTFLFWEFFTPFNLFGEPLRLIALELVFWAFIAVTDGLVIATLIGKRAPRKSAPSGS